MSSSIATTSYSDKLYNKFPGLWEKIKSHPLSDGITDGTLPMEKFRSFVIQRHLVELSFRKFLAFFLGKVPENLEQIGASDTSLYEVVGNFLANRESNKFFCKLVKDLKIEKSEIQPNLVTRGICDFFVNVGHSESFKDCLVILAMMNQSFKIMKQKLDSCAGRAKCGGNQVYEELTTIVQRTLPPTLCLATCTLNEIRGNDEVNRKQEKILKYGLLWKLSFMDACFEPEKWAWDRVLNIDASEISQEEKLKEESATC